MLRPPRPSLPSLPSALSDLVLASLRFELWGSIWAMMTLNAKYTAACDATNSTRSLAIVSGTSGLDMIAEVNHPPLDRPGRVVSRFETLAMHSTRTAHRGHTGRTAHRVVAVGVDFATRPVAGS